MGSPASMPDIKPGDIVAGRFRIVEVVGKGGFSVVYRAYQPSMDRFVALKVLKPHVLEDDKVVERFRREALYVSRLSHPNTITLFDYGDTDAGLCYIAMEFLKGRHLGSVLNEEGPMAPSRVWSIAVQVCQSLAEAHELDLIHRDLKPANIFLLRRHSGERVKVLDFGLSKSLQGLGSSSSEPISPLTQEGRVFGTPMYMAPEQAMDNPIGPSIDIYAMGHIIYQMITGEARYAELDHSMDIMLRQIYDSPLELPPQFRDSPFKDVVYECTRKAPEDRIADAGKLLETLRTSKFRPLSQPEDGDGEDEADDQKVVPVRSGHPPEDPARGPRTGSLGRHLDTLHEHLRAVEHEGTIRLAILDGLEGSGRDDILNAFLDEAADRGIRTVDESDWPAVDSGSTYRLLSERYPAPGQHESSIFGELSKRRLAWFARRGEALRRAAEDGPVIWSIPDLDRASAQTLAFLDWLIRDLKDRPAPIMILASLDRRRLRERTGLHRYTQGILGASGPEANYLTVQPGYTPPSLEELLAIGATSSEETSRPTNELESDAVTPVEQEAIRPEPSEDNEERVDHLRQALTILSLFGDEVPRSMESGIASLRREIFSEEEFEEALERAERIGIIVRDDEHLAFRRHTYANSLRKLEPPTPLKTPSAPLRAAELLLEANGDDVPRKVLDLAVDHFLEGGAPEHAAELLGDAVSSALEDLKLDDAREFLIRLVDILESHDIDGESALEVRLQLGEIQGALEELGSAEDILGDALVEAENSDNIAAEAQALKLMGDLSMRQNEPRRADGYYRKARLRFRQAGKPISAAGVATLLAEAQILDGRPDEATDALVEAREEIDSESHPVLQARLDARMGEALNRLTEFDRAAELLEKSARHFEDSRWPDEQRSVYFAAATAALGRGDTDAAEDFADRGCALHDYAPGVSTLECALFRADVQAARGDLERASDALDQFDEGAISTHEHDIRPAFYRGDIALARGDSAAVDWFETVLQRAREVGHTDWYLESLMRRAWALFEDGDAQESQECLARAQSFADHFGASAGIVGARARQLYFQVHQLDESPYADVKECLHEAEASDRTDARIIARTTMADVLLRRDAPDEAAEHLLVARREAARTGHFTVLIPIQRRLARCGRDGFTPASRWPGIPLGSLLPPTTSP